MIIAVDFDGTCVDHRYPDVGADVPGAVEWLRKFSAAGAKLILWTMRSDAKGDGDTLSDAIQWFTDRGLFLAAVNQNPEQTCWTDSPKAYAHVYIDDAAACCPMRENPRMGGRPYVDWDVVGPAVMQHIEANKKEKAKT